MRTVLLACLLALTACGGSVCKEAAHADDLSCVVQNAVVDCSTGAAVNAAKEFEPVVLALVSQLIGGDGVVNWASLESSLASLGLTDASCILAEVEGAMTARSKAGATADLVSVRAARTFSDGFMSWRLAHLPPGTRIKLPDGSLR